MKGMPSLKSVIRDMQRPKREPSPLDAIPLTGSIEEDSKVELTELQKGYDKRRTEEATRFRLSTDSEYWCAICFSSREQKEAFLSALGLLSIGDKYLDGYKVAEKLNVKLPPVIFSNNERKFSAM